MRKICSRLIGVGLAHPVVALAPPGHDSSISFVLAERLGTRGKSLISQGTRRGQGEPPSFPVYLMERRSVTSPSVDCSLCSQHERFRRGGILLNNKLTFRSVYRVSVCQLCSCSWII
jgi:hypothetical protein